MKLSTQIHRESRGNVEEKQMVYQSSSVVCPSSLPASSHSLTAEDSQLTQHGRRYEKDCRLAHGPRWDIATMLRCLGGTAQDGRPQWSGVDEPGDVESDGRLSKPSSASQPQLVRQPRQVRAE
eukprot:758493-Hanusia_phi.AAC.1